MFLLRRRSAFQTNLYFFGFTDGRVWRCYRIVSEDGLVTVTNQRWPSFAVTHRLCLWTNLWRFYTVNLQLGWLMKPGVPELEPEIAKNTSRVALVNTPQDDDFLHILWVLSFSGNYKSVCKYIVWQSFHYRTLKIFLIQSSATTIVFQIKFVHIFLVCTANDDKTIMFIWTGRQQIIAMGRARFRVTCASSSNYGYKYESITCHLLF